MSRLVEAPRGENQSLSLSVDFQIRPEHIDGYNHVNHGSYLEIFDEVNRRNQIARGMTVRALSASFREQFRKDDAPIIIDVGTFEGKNGSLVVVQQIKGEKNVMEQVTQFVPAREVFNPLLEMEQFNMGQKSPFAQNAVQCIVPGRGEIIEHTRFAPIFEEERVRVLEGFGENVESLRENHDLLAVVVQLDAAYGATIGEGDPIGITSQAFLDMKLKRGYMSMVFLQTARRPSSIGTVAQLTRYLFIDASGKMKALPADLEQKLLSRT